MKRLFLALVAFAASPAGAANYLHVQGELGRMGADIEQAGVTAVFDAYAQMVYVTKDNVVYDYTFSQIAHQMVQSGQNPYGMTAEQIVAEFTLTLTDPNITFSLTGYDRPTLAISTGGRGGGGSWEPYSGSRGYGHGRGRGPIAQPMPGSGCGYFQVYCDTGAACPNAECSPYTAPSGDNNYYYQLDIWAADTSLSSWQQACRAADYSAWRSTQQGACQDEGMTAATAGLAALGGAIACGATPINALACGAAIGALGLTTFQGIGEHQTCNAEYPGPPPSCN